MAKINTCIVCGRESDLHKITCDSKNLICPTCFDELKYIEFLEPYNFTFTEWLRIRTNSWKTRKNQIESLQHHYCDTLDTLKEDTDMTDKKIMNQFKLAMLDKYKFECC